MAGESSVNNQSMPQVEEFKTPTAGPLRERSMNSQRQLLGLPEDEPNTGVSDQADLLNKAQINSKPLSVLDELESFWERSDACKGIS